MPGDPLLTLVIPTRNRPRHCLAQLRFLRACGATHPILIADSSDNVIAQTIRTECRGVADYSYYDPAVNVAQKYLQTVESIATPFVVMLPDDDITFPHAIDASLTHLLANADYVAAHGYTLRFGMHGNHIDIHSVFGFTPTIDADRALYRHYDLMRRYQPFMWAVFRREAFAISMAGAAAMNGIVFQELTFMSRAVLKGKVARLPLIFAMRGMEESLSSAIETNPFLWFLNEPATFFRRYSNYRDCLAAFIRVQPHILDGLPSTSELDHVLDINHATFMGRAVDIGMINHQAQLLLGNNLPPIRLDAQWPGWREPVFKDIIHPSKFNGRLYVWRQGVLEAEPRDEIIITSDELANVEKQFDAYRLD